MVYSIANHPIWSNVICPSASYSYLGRKLWGEKIFKVLRAVNKENRFLWKADIKLPCKDWIEFAKIVRKFSSYYPKEKAPAFGFKEQSRRDGVFNIHLVGRGEITREELREVLIISLCKDKRRASERKRASREVDLHCEDIKEFEVVERKRADGSIKEVIKTPESCLRYAAKASIALANKVKLTPRRKRNCFDLGVFGRGGISGWKRKKFFSTHLDTGEDE